MRKFLFLQIAVIVAIGSMSKKMMARIAMEILTSLLLPLAVTPIEMATLEVITMSNARKAMTLAIPVTMLMKTINLHLLALSFISSLVSSFLMNL